MAIGKWVIGLMVFSIIVSGLVLFDGGLAGQSQVTLSKNLSNDPNLEQLGSMNQQLASASNQTAQINYNQQGITGITGFISIISTGVLAVSQEIWILGSSGISFLASAITTYIPIPTYIVTGILAIVSAVIFLEFLGLVLGRILI